MNVTPFRASYLDAERPRTCNLSYLRTALGRQGYGDRRMASYVTLLIEQRGFPKPLPTMRKTRLTDEVTPDSNWLRDAVDNWLADFLPPDAAAALDAAGLAAAAAEMDDAAHNLGRGALRIVGGSEA